MKIVLFCPSTDETFTSPEFTPNEEAERVKEAFGLLASNKCFACDKKIDLKKIKVIQNPEYTTIKMDCDGGKKLDAHKMFLPRGNGAYVVKSVLIDEKAKSADPSKPAFMAPPEGSKAFHGYPLIEETRIDGFCYGAITDFLQKDNEIGCTIGDGFVEGPDGSRASIAWELAAEEKLSYHTILEPDDKTWGMYYIDFFKPVNSLQDLKDNFKAMLPTIKEIYKKTH